MTSLAWAFSFGSRLKFALNLDWIWPVTSVPTRASLEPKHQRHHEESDGGNDGCKETSKLGESDLRQGVLGNPAGPNPIGDTASDYKNNGGHRALTSLSVVRDRAILFAHNSPYC